MDLGLLLFYPSHVFYFNSTSRSWKAKGNCQALSEMVGETFIGQYRVFFFTTLRVTLEDKFEPSATTRISALTTRHAGDRLYLVVLVTPCELIMVSIPASGLACYASIPEIELTPTDHKPFLSDNFDVNSYANSVLSGRAYDPEASTSSEPNSTAPKVMKGSEVEKGDVGVELARLSYGIVSLIAWF